MLIKGVTEQKRMPQGPFYPRFQKVSQLETFEEKCNPLFFLRGFLRQILLSKDIVIQKLDDLVYFLKEERSPDEESQEHIQNALLQIFNY